MPADPVARRIHDSGRAGHESGRRDKANSGRFPLYDRHASGGKVAEQQRHWQDDDQESGIPRHSHADEHTRFSPLRKACASRRL
jgi:hypothetical protein